MITGEVDQDQLREVRERLAYLVNGAERALARALNRTASKGKTLASRAIRAQIRLSAADVRERLNGPAQGLAFKATVNRLTARLSTPKRGLRLDHFLTSAPPTHPGRPDTPIRVRVKTAGASHVIQSAFWVRAKNSGGYLIAVDNDVLRRLGMTRTISGQLPYTALHGPSVSQVFAEVKDTLSDDLQTVLADNLEHEMTWLLNKYPPPADDGSAEDA